MKKEQRNTYYMHIMDDSQNLTLSQRSQTQRVHTACDIMPNKKKYSFKKKKKKENYSQRGIFPLMESEDPKDN